MRYVYAKTYQPMTGFQPNTKLLYLITVVWPVPLSVKEAP